jgi:FG-GAP repeat/FG-GAP-like repeat
MRLRHSSWFVPVLAAACASPIPQANGPKGAEPERVSARPQKPAPPRLIAPLTGYGVSSHKPSFRLELAPGSDGAEIEICRDRECHEVLAKFAGSSGHIRSSAILPEGRLFYRARSRYHGRSEGPASGAFQFIVRRGAPDVDTAFVAFNDANADGRDDELLFGAKDSAVFRVPKEETGRSYARVGDVNGDGFSDVLADAPCADLDGCPDQPMRLFLGGSKGFTRKQELPRPPGEAPDPDGSPEFSDAGDVDGDGYADIVEFFPSGGTYFYRGSAGGLRLPAIDLGEKQSTACVLGGDSNGDGFTDIVLAHGTSAPPFELRVYLGGADGPSPTRSLRLRAPDEAAGFGVSLAARGDVNADGFSDVVVGASSAPYLAAEPRRTAVPGQVYVFYGGARPSVVPDAVLRGTQADGAYFGLGLGVGDLDGNGAADVVGIAPCVERSKAGECSRGQAFLFEGSPAGIAKIPAGTLADPSTPSSQVVLIRDVDGDGFDDMSYAGSFYRGAPGGMDGAGEPGVP